MTSNVGGIERPIRILLGISLLGTAALANLPTWRWQRHWCLESLPF